MDDRTLIILLVIGFLIVDIIGAYFFIKSRGRKKADRLIQQRETYEQNFRRSLLATAKVTSVLNSNFLHSAKGNVKVDIRFEVIPPEREPYHAVSSWLVSSISIPLLQQGETMQVKIDPYDKTKIYPTVHWAEYWYFND